ncbi:MAG: hypothetical protein FJ276_01190 [Planctomycetes bacterium]|nr:hypothetical protein [Planctomycetota bacterium]
MNHDQTKTRWASGLAACLVGAIGVWAFAEDTPAGVAVPDLPDESLVETYRRAAIDNVLKAVNPRVFPGYFSVCADGQGFGYGNSYPSLDGHQMTDALLWLGQFDVARQNWDFVRSFQQADGRLPLAILPSLAGQEIGSAESKAVVAANGGLYEHWVPGNPLAALASPTYIQNADVIFRHTGDRQWLAAQIDSVNLAADYLASLTTPEGMVRGGGYYVERPTRVTCDGVAQCHAIDAFRRVAALNRLLGRDDTARRFEELAARVAACFTRDFWAQTHFAEHWHPTRGFITSHGLTDVDWAALATDSATPQQREILWPQLRGATEFYYGGMPTAISTRPNTYEDWEFTHPDRHDLASMGRVWYVECWARSRRQDAAGLLDTLRRVAREGSANGYSWRERYYPSNTGAPVPAGAEKYCEYPANFIRIVHQFLLGVDLRRDGSIVLAPNVADAFWDAGFGHVVRWPDAQLTFRLQRRRIVFQYVGRTELRLAVRCPGAGRDGVWTVAPGSANGGLHHEAGLLWMRVPPAPATSPSEIRLVAEATSRQNTTPPINADDR